MSGVKLLIVPAMCWLEEVEMFDGTNLLVLDDVLMSGVAGTVFRRMRVSSALHPAVRSEYDRKRHEYLASVVPGMVCGRSDVVVVGTHPTDVDLLDFDTVSAVRVSDHGMRDLGKIVYGDPLMSHIEYINVLRSIGDSVDTWFHVVHWREITTLALRQFPVRTPVDSGVSVVKQREVLSVVLADQAKASVWMEEEVQLGSRTLKGFLIADYDYLSVIRPKWRDAVVRLLGSAPAIDLVFRLPWHVVDPSMLGSLCFRTNAVGKPAVSMRGRSLVEFVRARLSGTLSARELIGTWIGALLCDGVTAVDTLAVLGVERLAPVDTVVARPAVSVEYVSKVPPEYMWMYEAIPDVVTAEWTGARHVDGRPVVRGVPHGWMPTLPLAEVYHAYAGATTMRAEVVQLMLRLHQVAMSGAMLASVIRHANAIHYEGPTAEVFDPGLTVLLPGYGYLACFASSVRLKAVGHLGCDPSLPTTMGYAQLLADSDGLVSVEEVASYAARSMLLAGRVWQAEMHGMRVGSRLLSSEPGYCYECLFMPSHRTRIKDLLGPYPTFQQVIDWRYTPWWIDDAMNLVHIVTGAYSTKVEFDDPVMHFTYRSEGFRLRDYMDHLWSRSTEKKEVMQTVRIGDNGSCQQIFVANIIAWTIVGVAVVAFFGNLLYQRCAGGSNRYGVGAGLYSRR